MPTCRTIRPEDRIYLQARYSAKTKFIDPARSRTNRNIIVLFARYISAGANTACGCKRSLAAGRGKDEDERRRTRLIPPTRARAFYTSSGLDRAPCSAYTTVFCVIARRVRGRGITMFTREMIAGRLNRNKHRAATFR